MGNPGQKNSQTLLLIAAIVLAGMELALITGALLSFVPIDQRALLADVFAKDVHIIKKDWKMLVYHGVIAAIAFLGWLALTRFKQYCFEQDKRRELALLCKSSAAWITLMVYALFFVINDPRPTWAWQTFGLAAIGAVLTKLFFPELNNLFQGPAVFKKAAIFGGFLFTGVFVLYNGGARAAGTLALWSVFLGGAIGAGWLLGRTDLSPIARKLTRLSPLADVLIWLCSKSVLANTAFAAGGIFLVSLLAIVDPVAVLAQTAFGEHYYHFDLMLMAGAYAFGSGNTLGVDQIAYYGIGLPALVGGLSKAFFGQVTYEGVFAIYWGLTIVYYAAFYAVMRYWLGSVLLAFAAVMLAVKWQVFYSLSYPVSAIYPNSSPLRCFLDIPTFILLWMFIKSGKTRYLWSAAALTGVAMVFMPTTGVDLYLALVAFAGMFFILRKIQKITIDRLRVATALLIPLACALIGFFFLCGKAVFAGQFWKDLMFYPHLFTNGFYDIWFWDNLMHGHYVDFAVGVLFPVLYLFTMLWIGFRLYRREGSLEEMITFAVCAYGLSLYHHYLVLSLQNNYFMRAVVFIWVIFYWVKGAMNACSSSKARALWAWGLAAGCLFFLLTDKLYQAFPNYWNSLNVRNPIVDKRTARGLPEDGRPYFFHQEAWTAEKDKLAANSVGTTQERIFFEWQVPDHETLKALYAQEFDFKEDVALIRALTTPSEKTALLSSFEIEILRQAGRRPYFFYFPVISSRGMDVRTFPHTNIYTKGMQARMIQEIESSMPEYIFMERIFLSDALPASYAVDHEELLGVIAHIRKHYQPFAQGKYLTAMKRVHVQD